MSSKTISIEKLISSINSLDGFSCFTEHDLLVIARKNEWEAPFERTEFCLKDVTDEFDQFCNARWNKPFYINKDRHFEARVFYQGSLQYRPRLSLYADNGVLACQSDSEDISITISDASNGFKLLILCEHESYNFEIPLRMSLKRSLQSLSKNKSHSFSEFLSHIPILTVQVDSASELETEYVANLLEGYYLNIAQVFNIVVTTRLPFKSKQTHLQPNKDIDLFPYKLHEESVTKYYLQAVSSKGTPIAEYLSFYHVIEYQFDRELKNQITRLIQQAAYSCKKSKSMIDNTYKEINSIYMDRKLRGQELSDLMRCINSFVEIPFLLERINELQNGASQYYQRKNVEFIVDDENPDKTANLKIDFLNEETAYKQIAKRIYSVRCSIVHSKSNVNSRYEPFLHDELLHKEMPLVRAVAEEVLRGTSDLRKF